MITPQDTVVTWAGLSIEQWKDLAASCQSIVTAIGIVVGGVWAYRRFVSRREGNARIALDVHIDILGRVGSETLVQLVAFVENKGFVRHCISKFYFDLHYLPRGVAPGVGDDSINQQALFENLIRRRAWIPGSWHMTFVDPGIRQRYTYITSTPGDVAFLLLYTQFSYADSESGFHTAQEVVAVPHAPSPDSKAALE